MRRLRCELLEDRRMLSIAGFETGLDDWVQSSGDDGDWTRQTGSTPSADTGPAAAYSGSYYLYTEASSTPGYPDKSACLDKTFDLSTFDNPKLTFYYHMHGADMGTLYVDVNDGSGWVTDVWHISGEQQSSSSDAWTQAAIDLSAYAGESSVTVRIRGVTGSGETSDMAIDDVEMVDVDIISPTVTSCLPAIGETVTSSSINIDVTFSEEVQGVDAADLALSNTAAIWASVNDPVDLGGNTWRFTVSGLVSGTLDVSLAADADGIEDLAGNDLDPSPTQWTYTVSGSATPTAVDLVAASDTGISDSDDLTNLDNSTTESALQFEVSGTIAGATVTIYCDGVAIGSAVATDTTTIVTTNGSYNIADGIRSITARQVEEGQAASDISAVLSLTIDTAAPEQADYIASKLLAGDGAAYDYFGYSVSIDGSTAIVGAYLDDDKGSSSGSAYIFQYTATGWEQVAKLTADDGAISDYFGFSVSISGTTAIVGAYNDDDNGSNSGSAYIFEQTDIGWEQVAKLTADDGAYGDYFGYSVSIEGTTAIVGAYQDDDKGSSSGSAYIFELTDTGWEQVAKFTAGDGASSDYFGYSVSICGTTAIVGAYGDDDRGSSSGSAYIFELTNTGWRQIAKLRAADGAASDYFGFSVSISDAIVIVGSYQDDDKGSASGSAYIFQETSSGWTQAAKLTAADGAASDYFGYSVSISDTKAIVGAYQDDDSGTSSGSAYIFEQTDMGWEQVIKLTADDGSTSDFFGHSVSISDVTVIVGADFDDDNGRDSGSVYTLLKLPTIDLQASSDTGPLDSDNITNNTTPTFDILATPYYRIYRNGVQISSDYETASTYTSETLPDGVYNFTIIAIDAAGNETFPSSMLSITMDTTASDVAGIAPDLQTASDTGISNTDNLTNDNTPTFAVTGTEYFCLYRDGVKISDVYESGSCTTPLQTDGTYNYSITIVDEAGNESPLCNSISVTIDTVAPDTPNTVPDLQAASDSGISDTDNITNDTLPVFDISAAGYYRLYRNTILVSGDYETVSGYASPSLPDGTYQYAITAVDAAGNESDPGSTLDVTIDTISPLQAEYIATKVLGVDGAESDYFGYSVSISGTTAIVGAYLDDDNGSDSGSAYIFEQTDTGWVQIAKLTADDGAEGDYFGYSVSISGTTAIVGAYKDDDNGSDSGSAYIFEQTDTGWEQVAKLISDDGTAYECFGCSVSISGTMAIVGEYSDHDNGLNSGSAYIFQYAATGWEQVAKLTADDGAANDRFGFSVSISGTTAVVGAYWDDDNGSDSGSAYIFQETASGWEQVAKLKASDGSSGDYFGYSVSISGTTAVVGAYADDDNGSASGSAYVFQATASGWEQVAKLTADDGTKSDYFGYSVSVSGTTAIVGARYDDNNGSDSGSAYIFEKTDTNWEQVGKLTADDGAASDYFGYSVSVSGTTTIVGSYGNNDNGSDSGSAYMFLCVPTIDLQASSDTGLADTDNITSNTTPTFDITATPYYRVYRNGVLVSDDWETALSYTSEMLPDGIYEYTVCAVDVAGNESQPSFILSVTIDTVAPDVTGIVPDLQSDSDTGISDSDNLTNDSTPTFEVTGTEYFCLYRDGVKISDGYESGSSTTPLQTDGTYNYAITIVDEAGNESLLYDSISVTIDTVAPNTPNAAPDLQVASDSGISDTDNITNDSTPTFDIIAAGYYRLYRNAILVSGDYETTSSYTSLSSPDGTYQYAITKVDAAGNESSLSPAIDVTVDTMGYLQSDYIVTKLFDVNSEEEDRFGCSVSVCGTTAIVGACYDDDNGSASGSAYIYEQTDTGWKQVATLNASDGASGDCFGASVATNGNIAVVGSIGDDNNAGSVYIFELTDTGWTQVAKLTANDGATYDYFGCSVSISGSTVTVGADGDDDNGSKSGAAYIFTQTDLGWQQVAKLTADDGEAGDIFGCSVSISGTTAIIGAYGDNLYGGSAYIFAQTDTGWVQVAKLFPYDGMVYDNFGRSVSISGATAVVGTFRADTVYVFKQTTEGWEQVDKLTAVANSHFGYCVSVSENTIIVGAYWDDDNGDASGAIYVYQKTNSWEQIAKLTADDGMESDYFGWSVSISGSTAIIGAYGDDDNGSNSGSAYIFSYVPTIDLQAASDTGISDSDNITDDTTPTFDIGATPYYRVYRDGVQVSGDWETASAYTSETLPDGTYYFTGVAVDEAGNKTLHSDSLVVTIEAPNVAPVADAGGPYEVEEGGTITLDASASTDTDGTIVLYEWELDGDGQYDDAVGATTEFTANAYGTYQVALRVTDNEGATSEASAQVAVLAANPYPGDANRDGTVDSADSVIVSAHWLTQSGAAWANGDFNDDGMVNSIDATLMAANWGRTLPVRETSTTAGEAAAATVEDEAEVEEDAVTLLPGDANGDGRVDGIDVAVLTANWRKTSGAVWADGDFSGDGRVDDDDAKLLAINWRKTTSRSTLSANISTNAVAVVAGEALAENDAASSAILPGDANLDGRVDDSDAVAISLNWRKSSGAVWADGDFSGDGRVDDLDAAILAQHWMMTVKDADKEDDAHDQVLAAIGTSDDVFGLNDL